jgi:hypothetical protein
MLVDENDLPILTQHSEEGFVDCIFKVDGLKSDESHYYFNLMGSHEGQQVGFAVKLVKHVGPGFDGDMNLIREHVYRHGVSFRSLGEVSDRLINVLADLYGLGLKELRMVPEETFTAIALQQDDTDLLHGVKFKLFGRDQEEFDEDAYYESFFNVDLSAGLVSWNEKDPDYRVPLIRAMSG